MAARPRPKARRRLVLASAAAPALLLACGAVAASPSAAAASAEVLRSVGDPAMAELMDAWFAAFSRARPGAAKGLWRHDSASRAIGALMFERADVAPLMRAPSTAELAPYDHQFKGDMMRAPLLVRVGRRAGHDAFLAVNRRGGAPLPPAVAAFLRFALSGEGQALAAAAGFQPLSRAEAATELAKTDGYLPPLDPDLKPYEAVQRLTGEISSVGSDGMKSLMDRWAHDFALRHPGVRKGERWEHFGTLNGFHALLLEEADLAPMGRELWPQERETYGEAFDGAAPIEIRVARGGFNTPQRTTAQAIFVNGANPLRRIATTQLRQILSANPMITRWGQLGLGGDWKDRPIHVYIPPRAAPNTMSVQSMVLGGGAWNAAAREGTIAETAASVAADPAAIAFGGFEEGAPELVTLEVATRAEGPYYAGTAETVSSGRYPLTRSMYIRLNRPRSGLLPLHIREFIRFILSRDGQEPVRYSGYFPLSAAEAADELAKLDR